MKMSLLSFLCFLALTGLACRLTGAPANAAPGQPTEPAARSQPGQPAPKATAVLASPANRPSRTPVKPQSDLTYCTSPEGVALKMDLYPPTGSPQDGPTPAVVYVHGGGWMQGDKNEGSGAGIYPLLQRSGFLVAAINYRLAPQYKFPAQIIDVKCAVRYLRANAAAYNIDPQRIGAVGGSAGGHLVALLGVTTAEAGWDTGEYADQSSRVQAVVDMFGPTDLTQLPLTANRGLGKEVFGLTGRNDPLLLAYSPVTYITPDDPPFLILHGDQDELVPLQQSQILYERLQAAGVPAELVVVKNAMHAFRPAGGEEIQPSGMQLFQTMIRFLNRYL